MTPELYTRKLDRHMVRVGFAIALVVGCAKPPPPAPPPAELLVSGLASIAGVWVAADDLDWSYRATIETSGRYVLHVDRNRLGACDEKGALTATPGKPRTYALVFGENMCHRELSGTAATLEVTSYTGAALELAVTGDGLVERHRFTRAPAQ
jgi:hypothetical protein